MKINNDIFRISNLIYKSVIGAITATEKEDLDTWLIEDENQKLYNYILNNESIENKREIYDMINVDLSKKKLQNRIDVLKIKKARRLSFYKYAAVAVFFISVGIAYTFMQNGTNQNLELVKDIMPGYEKATLILADGTTIDLEKEDSKLIKSTGRLHVKDENNVLKYKATGKRKSKTLAKTVYNTLHVPVGGIYKIELSDNTKVWLNSKSSIKYPEVFIGNKRIVELDGEAYFEVAKNEGKEFIVKTKSKDITVLGTSFNVSSYCDDVLFSAALAEGKIKISGDNNTDEIYLSPGEIALFDKEEDRDFSVFNGDVEVYSSWKDGKFYFERASLEELFKKAGRWYDFEPVFIDEDLKKQHFTGTVSKKYPLETLLNMISVSSRIKYNVIKKDNRYIVEVSKK